MSAGLTDMLHKFSSKLLENIHLNEHYILAMIFLFAFSFAILVSVGTGFVSGGRKPSRKKKKCIVSTFSMSLVFFMMVPLIHHHILTVKVSSLVSLFYFLTGALLVTEGALANIYARHHIQQYWSDHIEIREDHRLVTDGPYAHVRHPLYSSLIFFGIGIASIFQNIAVFLIILLLFIPMMIYRARSEEKEIKGSNLAGYAEYHKQVSFLIPAMGDRISYALRITGIIFFGAILIENKITLDKIIFLSTYLLLISFLINTPKVIFVYRIKAAFLLLIFFTGQRFPAVTYLYYMIFCFTVIGLFINCPGMKLYEILMTGKNKSGD